MACKRISYLETPTRKVGLKNSYLICDYYGGSHEAEECSQNSPTEQNDDIPLWGNIKRKEKGEDGPEWVVTTPSQSTPTDHAEGANEKKDPWVKNQALCKIKKPPIIHSLSTLQVNFIVLEMDEDELVPIILGQPFLIIARAVSKYSRNNYLYCTDHTAKLVQEQWVDTIDHDGTCVKAEEDGDPNKVHAVSFYPRTETVEPLEWKASKSQLNCLS
uniref:Uncharacterized protein n=1 Tax=Tanacetum cinerariifolium TaxID=118510 RepID=A0A699HFV1_TANCI|nr:hypothetical protein [Tanacetum cinerariifolium]